MPPPSSENDIKRLARRRLIGAVALTLLAVILLPLLLEDEPPPTSSLSVHMAAAPAPIPEQATQPERTEASGVAAMPTPSAPEPQPEPAKPVSKASPMHEAAKPTHEAVKPARVEPVKSEPAKATPKPAKLVPPPVAPAKSEAAGETYVVQLAALSDGAKARELKARAALAGLPVYTDSVGNLTRVRVGPYATREAAVAAAGKLAENGMTGQVLAR
jgi:DedD protein